MATKKTAAAPMTVYDGTRAIGEIQDCGRKRVRAWLGGGPARKLLGTYPDRTTAMRAVSAADKADALRRLDDPHPPFVTGLPAHFLRRG
jgi:hypothetical protein